MTRSAVQSCPTAPRSEAKCDVGARKLLCVRAGLKAGICCEATMRRGRDLRCGALAKQKSCDLFCPTAHERSKWVVGARKLLCVRAGLKAGICSEFVEEQ